MKKFKYLLHYFRGYILDPHKMILHEVIQQFHDNM